MANLGWNEKTLFVTLAVLCSIHISSSQQQPQTVYQHDFKWPTTLSFQETKTNAMLGEAMLKRMYSRIGFTDNIIRAEMDTLFENLKEVLEKKLRKCERKRRRAGRISSYDSPYTSVVNASLANQYTPRGNNGRTYYG